MRPIDHTVDISLCQALSCAEFRFPRLSGLKSDAAELTLGLRYSLIGLAAHSFILSNCDLNEKQGLLNQLRFFGTMIREHIDQDQLHNPHHRISPTQSTVAQSIYRDLFERYCELLRLHCPLDLGLSILVEEFVTKHSAASRGKIFSWTGRAAKRAFEIEAQKSLEYALCFFERRKHDLEELPEIALLGE